MPYINRDGSISRSSTTWASSNIMDFLWAILNAIGIFLMTLFDIAFQFLDNSVGWFNKCRISESSRASRGSSTTTNTMWWAENSIGLVFNTIFYIVTSVLEILSSWFNNILKSTVPYINGDGSISRSSTMGFSIIADFISVILNAIVFFLSTLFSPTTASFRQANNGGLSPTSSNSGTSWGNSNGGNQRNAQTNRNFRNFSKHTSTNRLGRHK